MPDSARDRGVAPLAGVLVVLVTVAIGATVSGAVLAGGYTVAPADTPRVSLSLAVEGETLVFTHRGGDSLTVTDLDLVVTVDGDPLRHQPPVPFFSARGFSPGPTGPFNSAADPRSTAGETASVRVAGTNHPGLETGVVAVRVYRDGALVAEVSTR